MKVAVLTGGGDCPGLNAVIRAIVRRTMGKYGGNVVGFRYGWAGVIDNKQMPLGLEQVSGILPEAGPSSGRRGRTPTGSKEGSRRSGGPSTRRSWTA